jgi:hypothetical protein
MVAFPEEKGHSTGAHSGYIRSGFALGGKSHFSSNSGMVSLKETMPDCR